MIRTILLWAIPPVMGAIIGYVTNAIAIKMLFRPLKEIRVFNIRLPFTPGILPRERHRLALNIGSMVERELFTPEILRRRLQKEDVRSKLGESVSGYTGQILMTPVRELIPGTSVAPVAISAPVLSDIARFISFSLKSFLYSPSLESIIGKVTEELAGRLGDKSLRDILGEENTGKLETALYHIVRDSLKRSASQVTEHIIPVVEKAFAPAASSLVQFLMKDEIHTELEFHGRIFLTNAVLKLNAIQRFFISAGQYDKTIHEKMPEIIDDLVGQLHILLKDKKTRKRFMAFLEKIILNTLSSENSVNQVSRFVMGVVSTFIDEPLADLLKRSGSRDIRVLGEYLVALIRNQDADAMELRLGQVIDSFFRTYRDVSLSAIFTLSPGQKRQIDDFIADKILLVADEKIESLLHSIDIKSMVAERIDSLDMIRVERIVLDVMDDQLQWINIFGAILGALIGLFQAAFGWIAR